MTQQVKDVRIFFRTSRDMQESINKQAQRLNVSTSDYIRTLIHIDLCEVELKAMEVQAMIKTPEKGVKGKVYDSRQKLYGYARMVRVDLVVRVNKGRGRVLTEVPVVEMIQEEIPIKDCKFALDLSKIFLTVT